jgi:Domain of unknown function (DUF4184)
VPFTLAHSAAALPFRRLRLVPSALVIGTLAPDFEYLVKLDAHGRLAHTFPGVFVLTLPLALVVLWIFHRFVKLPVVRLLPDGVQGRLSKDITEFRFLGASRFLHIVVSILVGIATHILWDSFTHRGTWLYAHWPLLRQTYHLPFEGTIPLYKALQHGSSVLGVGVILIWLVLWYRGNGVTAPTYGSVSTTKRIAIFAGLIVVACVGVIVRRFLGPERPIVNFQSRNFMVEAAVTVLALVWWQLVAYGVFQKVRGENE